MGDVRVSDELLAWVAVANPIVGVAVSAEALTSAIQGTEGPEPGA